MVYLDDYKEISEDDSNVYVYGSKPHAVTSITSGGQTIRQYTYDLNGNMTQRIEGSDTYTFTYDTENRLMSGAKNGVTLASYTYDGDGKRVKAQEGGFTTYYIGDYYEWREGPTTTAVKYYYAAGQRIAMRKAGTLTWLLGDHLGSTTITANENSTLASEQTYTAWGQTRSGSVTTDRQYTGQISEPQLGIYFYNARFYDSYLNRFLSADSIIPGIPGRSFSPLTVDNQYISLLEQLNQENKELVRVGYLPVNSQAYDRYAYSLNNPIRYNDPDGHDPITMTLGLGFAFSIGAPEVILVVLVVGVVIVAYDTFAPGRDQRHEDIKNLWN